MKEIDCKEYKCPIGNSSESCIRPCELEEGYCVYEEIEFLRKSKLEDYIYLNFPGENDEEKMNNYIFELFEDMERWGENDEDHNS